MNDLTEIGVILSLLVGLGSLGWQIYREKNKMPAENQQARGNASESFARAAQIEADHSIEINKRLELAEQKLEALEKNEKEYKVVIEDLQDWSERLCHQVHALGGTPVQLRKRTVH